MTGYGKAAAELNGKKFIVEIRSLNSKQLDLNLRLPSGYRELEPELRSLAAAQIERGKVEIGLNIEATENTPETSIDKKLAKYYYDQLKSLADQLGEKSDLLPQVLRMPDVVSISSGEPGESELALFRSLVSRAIESFNEFRNREGETLEKDLLLRISLILENLAGVEKYENERLETVKSKLTRMLEENVGKDSVDNNRFEQELIYYMEKLDITEEKIRLRAHCSYFTDTAKETSSGRKLSFITQELGREINTIGSKANHLEIQKLVVQMKDELEKIKEQLNNIL